MTWGHSRGITPLLAASQRYTELHPDVEICWKKRTLHEFADFPIEQLTQHYDLLIIDHPWVGCAAATRCVLDLNGYLSTAYLDEQLGNSVGDSHQSYQHNNGQWALAIDAATPVASYRNDLFQSNNIGIPQTWEEVIELAKRGKIAVPGIPIDMLMNFYMACIAWGQKPFQNEEQVIDEETGIKAIGMLKQLYSLVDKKMFECNPIAIAELMTTTDDYWYCPFAYGYSNYARTGYAKHVLHYTDVVKLNDKRLQTTIGGTGLAVSTFSKHITTAVDFAQWIVSGEMQRTLYVQHGGQPAHRSAWTDESANLLTHNFFKNTLSSMGNSYMRPRYNGYLYFQDQAGEPLQQCILHNGDVKKALYEMNLIYQNSIKNVPSNFIA
jgi:multiple sugar transport system substrate-binding protein